MDDPPFVSRFKRLADAPRDAERFLNRNRPALDAFGERFAIDQLEDEKSRVPSFLKIVDCGDVRMIQ